MAKHFGLAILIVASLCTSANAQRAFRRYATPIVVPAVPIVAPPIVVQPQPFTRGYYRPGVRAIRRSSTVDVTFQLPGVILGGPLAPVTYFTPPGYGFVDRVGVYYPPYGYPQYAAQYNGTVVNPYGGAFGARRSRAVSRVQNVPSGQMQQFLSSPQPVTPKVLPGQFQSALSGNTIQPVAGQLPPSATQSLILQPTPSAESLPPAKSEPKTTAKPVSNSKPAEVPADPVVVKPDETDIPPAPNPDTQPAEVSETDLPPVIPSASGK